MLMLYVVYGAGAQVRVYRWSRSILLVILRRRKRFALTLNLAKRLQRSTNIMTNKLVITTVLKLNYLYVALTFIYLPFNIFIQVRLSDFICISPKIVRISQRRRFGFSKGRTGPRAGGLA